MAEGQGPTESVAQARPALPVLVKARVCARPQRGLLETGAEDQGCLPATFPAESAGVRACAERPPPPPEPFDLPALARAREAKVHGGLGAAAVARARGRSRAAGPALSRRRAILPVSPAVPALRL